MRVSVYLCVTVSKTINLKPEIRVFFSNNCIPFVTQPSRENILYFGPKILHVWKKRFNRIKTKLSIRSILLDEEMVKLVRNHLSEHRLFFYY